jgi:hypothetical protein
MQLRQEAVEAGGKAAPILEPLARKAQRDLGGIERTLVDAGAAYRTVRPGAAGEELLGLLP